MLTPSPKMLALGCLGLLAAAAGAVSWYRAQSAPPASTIAFVQQAPAVKVATVEVPGPATLKVLNKAKVAKKLPLPETVTQNEAQQVTATASLPAHEGKTTVATVTDTQTGESVILAKQEPLPLVDFESVKELGVRVGPSLDRDGMQTAGEAYGRWQFLRVGRAHLGVYGEVGSRGEARAQLECGVRW